MLDFYNENQNDLKNMGFSEADIARLKSGLNPKGYQVHHILPLDDSGTNSFSNLVLIKNTPFHKAISNYQWSYTSKMIVGETIIIDWPIFPSRFYNGN